MFPQTETQRIDTPQIIEYLCTVENCGKGGDREKNEISKNVLREKIYYMLYLSPVTMECYPI